MNEHKTRSMLQRLPVILAVTAASYGLPLQAQTQRVDRAGSMHNTVSGTPHGGGTDALNAAAQLPRKR